MHTKVLIVGGGLSGLHTAYQCHKHGIDYCLLEARDRLGGRVLSYQANQTDYDAAQPAFDLGPSWFWPGQQHISALIQELGLSAQVFSQSGDGDAIYEDQHGNIQRGIDGISMAGAYRLVGGIRQLVSTLKTSINDEKVLLDAEVKSINFAENKITAKMTAGKIKEINSNYVVLAMPPRVAIARIKFSPEFSESRTSQLNDIATWMAGHAKFVSVYEHNFWQAKGLSGDAISHKGPLQEVHDASSSDGNLNALFGFVGVPPVYRNNRQQEIKTLAIAQLGRLFGDEANKPKATYLQDWSAEKFTATSYDQEIQRYHPANNIAYVQEPKWDKRLIWSGTEAADYSMQNNGFLEGAIEASIHAFSLINR